MPNSIQVLDREDIQRGEIGLSLEESLRSVPGVLVNNRNNLSQGDRISIRGIGSRASFGVRGIKLVVDEIPLTLSDGQSQLNNLDLGSTGQIEVWRGPSSSLYGNASGGLINIKTELPTEPGLVFQPKVIVGSHGLQKWQGKISGTIGQSVFLINTTRLKTQGFREHSAAKSTSMNGLWKHTLFNSSE
ncbi:TonB-dependent receptor plug domain-containing protein, partial [candidate division KSB1 bacterium]|nr:TonB-dependent receptor plug domain-containing protein [candidate division KSB1 bacterium]